MADLGRCSGLLSAVEFLILLCFALTVVLFAGVGGKVIGYVTLGTNDLERAVKFYDELLVEIGAKRFMEEEGYFVAWAVDPDAPSIAVTKPFDGNPATVGNGMMVAIAVGSPDKVDSFHKKAIALGATDEGEPGPRAGGGFYAGYFRDLDGNKLNAFCVVPHHGPQVASCL